METNALVVPKRDHTRSLSHSTAMTPSPSSATSLNPLRHFESLSRRQSTISDCGMKEIFWQLITANHILHHQGLVDAFGHVSARHPTKPDVYIMARESPPALVESPEDLLEYWILDSQPLDPNAQEGYQERFIHGEIYKRCPDVQAVVHSHDDTVMPYCTSGVPLLPVIHMAGFLGNTVPVFDIAPLYESSDTQSMLVNSCRFGGALAETFSPRSNAPDHNVVLMRRHGFTCIGPSIACAVFRAVYTAKNAAAQMKSIMLRNAFAARPGSIKFMNDPSPLTRDQVVGCARENGDTCMVPWKEWCREVQECGLYVNKV